ncbi:follistatin isoform X1 [Procambarus clarkii]|uniref:follistatin isoform X1 n=1 Tax=Procambarus clarkii TaxID=6728 RepID=UPI00374388C7
MAPERCESCALDDMSSSRGRKRPPLKRGSSTVSNSALTALLAVVVVLQTILLHQAVEASSTGAGVGVCWRLKHRDGSCGRLLSSEMTRESCCSGRHRRGWSAAVSATTASLKPFNATSYSASELLPADDTCMPCSVTCAGVRCGEDRKCVVRCGSPRCVCSPQCHLQHKEAVCGSDGRTYKSECHLLKRACRKKKRLLVAHYGPCQTCIGVRCGTGKKCVLDEQMTPRCVRCPTTCPALDKSRPICAADNRTYLSPCHLKRASCRAAAEIPRAYKGPCREDASCSDVRCWRDQQCLTRVSTGKPQCTTCGSLDSCRPSSRPVCATNGRVYPSWCAFRHEACRSGRALIPTLHQHCAANHTDVDNCNKHHYKSKKYKQRLRQEQIRKQQENDLRHQIVTQRVLQGMVEAAGASTLGQINLEDNHNGIEGQGGGGGVVDTDRRRSKTNISDRRKKRKRRRRRRNCKKNRKRTRKERQRTRKEQKATRVEGD